MAFADGNKADSAEKLPAGSSLTDMIPIDIHLDELPGTPEEIRELARAIAAALIESPAFPEITEKEGEGLALQLEAQVVEALATLRFDQEVVERVMKSFRPVRESIKGIGQLVWGLGHAG